MNKIWLGWVFVSVASFAVLEWYGASRFGEPGTLSAHVRYWSNIHPLIPFTLGCVVGGLAIHFWALGNLVPKAVP